MLHQKRIFGVGDIEGIEELAEKLTETTWTLCTGFRFQGLLFLNDSFTEDSAQEYAVKPHKGTKTVIGFWRSSEVVAI